MDATLSWKSVSGAKEYMVSVNGYGYITTKSTTCVVKNLSPMTCYEFGVAPMGESVQGTTVEVSAETDDTPSPTNIRYSVNGDTITFSWNKVDGAELYQFIEGYKVVAVCYDNGCVLEGVDMTQDHTFYVRACVDGNYSNKADGAIVVMATEDVPDEIVEEIPDTEEVPDEEITEAVD